MNADEVRAIIKERIGSGSQRAFARKLGLSSSYINSVMLGLREPSGPLLVALGLRRVVEYEYKRGVKSNAK